MDISIATGLRRTTGVLLVLGFVLMLAGALMFVSRSRGGATVARESPRLAIERSLIMAAVVLTAIGLWLLQDILKSAGGLILAPTGATTYLFAAVLIVVAEAIGLGQDQNLYPLIVVYVVLAFLAQAAIGGALIQTGLLPVGIGWATLVWNVGWLVVLAVVTPRDIYFPVLHHVMPLAIGIGLLVGG